MQDKGEALQLEERAEGIGQDNQEDSPTEEQSNSGEMAPCQQGCEDGLGDGATSGELADESSECQQAPLSQEMTQYGTEQEQADEAETALSSTSQDESAIQIDRDAADRDLGSTASMDNLMQDMGHDYRSFRRGDIVEGTIVTIDKDGLLVDIGTKSEAIVPGHEAARYQAEGKEPMQVGDEIVACVVQPENADGHVVLSLSRARVERGWRQVQKLFDAGQSVEADVVDHNKGGLIVNIDSVRGFVPISQIVGLRQNASSEGEIESRLAEMVGQRIPVKVLEINRRRNRLILSERAAVSERRALRKEQLLNELQEGEIRQGKVSSICDFGAFIDLGGADGLVHLSELSWGQVGHPNEVVKVGDEVSVYVLSVDKDKKKIALSMRRSQPEPWSLVGDKYKPDDVITATITKLATFGAFARVEPGVEGLIHVSELAEGHVAHPNNVVKEGDAVQVRVIRVDPERRRLGLSLRQAPQIEPAAEEEVSCHPEGEATQSVEQSDKVDEQSAEAAVSESEVNEAVVADAEPTLEESVENSSPDSEVAVEDDSSR